MNVTERCLVPIQFLDYKNKIWCDVIPMDVGHIILGRPCLFYLDVTIYGRSNSCSFKFKSTKIQLNPLPLRPKDKQEGGYERKKFEHHKPKRIEREANEEYVTFVMVAKEISKDSREELSEEVGFVFKDFQDILPKDLLDHLPPMRDIQHAIDFVLEATLPNLPHYRINLTKHIELKRQRDELL